MCAIFFLFFIILYMDRKEWELTYLLLYLDRKQWGFPNFLF